MLPYFAAIVTSTAATTCCAQAFIEHVSPPSLERGAVTRVTVVGSEMARPEGLWTSVSGAIVTAKHTGTSDRRSAQFDVAVAEEAPLGFYGLRLATADGLSNVHLFLIDDLAAIGEVESDSPSAPPQPVPLPAAVAGICRKTDVDRYAIQVKEGQRVTFELIGNRLGKDFDPLVTVRDARGRQVASRDNDAGLFFDCRFEHTFNTGGTYTVEVRDSRFHGSDHWTYVLRMGNIPVARAALPSTVRPGAQASLLFPQIGPEAIQIDVPTGKPMGPFYFELRRRQDDAAALIPLAVTDLANALEAEPNDNAEQATAISTPEVLHGNLSVPGDRDYFCLDLTTGQALAFVSEARVLGSPADLELTLLDPAGKRVQRADDSGFDDARFSFTAAADGRHVLIVRDVNGRGGPEFVYRVEARPPQPQIALTSKSGRLTIPQGTRQPLPLVLARNSYDGPVALSLVEAPPGVQLETGTIPAGSGAVTNALVVAGDAPTGIYTVQVAARATAGDRELSSVAATHPLVDRLPTGRGPHGEPFELREDQRRLPPSLTDRIALLITPPAPFEFTIAEDVVVLPRYQQAEFHIQTERADGFAAPISFVARGGTLDADRLRPPRVRTTIPNATAESDTVTALLRSGVNTELAQHRVTVTGTAVHEGRKIFLTRTFDLQLQIAYKPSAIPARVEIAPGDSATVQILANRLKPFAGPVTVALAQVPGLVLPKTVTIPEAQESMEITLKAAPDAKPGNHAISLQGVARVAKFEEANAGEKLQVVINPAAATP